MVSRITNPIVIIVAFVYIACTGVPKNFNSGQLAPAPTPLKTPFVPRNGDYKGRGKVTRIETKGGSIEIDHEEIPDLMPAKKTEIFVSDKALLNGLKLGDEVNFALRYNNGQETILDISKIQ